ncbi:Lipase [Strongyloides ratti]|uniref:Lipase n=1 Tax=Strongyloides ratti TaxID=34506 RepID=A0A090L4W6_STRRB|nr:Lipase [Strongyloides ratti]CEF64742.1 Lipase [Strongyloides ratti]
MNKIIILLFFVKCFVSGKDPEVEMTPIEMIEYWGYEGQDIEVVTEDGYILHMHRIPQGKNFSKNQKRPVVFMQHGLLSASTDWITNLPNESAGFMFADAGFDVYLGNVRGNTYSTGHVSLDTKSKEYWKFSWDEMVKYDLDAMINKALEISGQDHLYYIGHSQGTLIMFSKLSIDSTFKNKVRQFHALAPVGTVTYIKGALEFLAKLLYPEIGLVEEILGDKNFMPNNWLIKLANKAVCEKAVIDELCDNMLFLIGGPNSNQMNVSRVQVYIGHSPSDTSIQNMVHWMQMVHTGRQEMYDYRNEEENQKHYGQIEPPVYDITKINGDTYLYWGDIDWLGDPEDIKMHLLPNLDPKILKGNYQYKDFNHLDFIWGLRAAPEIYKTILQNIMDDIKHK